MALPDEESFYVGYLPQASADAARFVRRAVGIAGGALILAAIMLAAGLPYFGTGRFEFGRAREFTGRLHCEFGVARLIGEEVDYVLVGQGKHGVPPELCGSGSRVEVRGSLIEREGKKLIEVARVSGGGTEIAPAPTRQALGRFTLRGEIVDSKCYFGVMNPAEGRLHRACAELCLRGGVPAVFVVRDRAGQVLHLLLSGENEREEIARLLPWVGRTIELEGEVERVGRWLHLTGAEKARVRP